MKKTITQLFEEGHFKLRRDPWNKYAYIKLRSSDKKHFGPVVELYDAKQYFENEKPVEIFIFEIGHNEPIWEPWEDPNES